MDQELEECAVSRESVDAGRFDPYFHYACLAFLLLVGGWLFLTRIDGSLSLWDEAYYAAIGKKSLEFDLVMFPAVRPDWTSDKPALYFWMLKWSMRVFGVNGYGLRFPSCFGAYVSVLLVYLIGRRLYGTGVGILAALILMFNKDYHLYPRNSFLDPPMVAMQLGVVWCAIQGSKFNRWHLVLGSALLGLLFFLKQLLGLSVIAPVIAYWAYLRFLPRVGWRSWCLSGLAFFITGCGWYVVAWIYDPTHVKALLFQHNLAYRFSSGLHADPWYYWNIFTDGLRQGPNLILYMGIFSLVWVVVEFFKTRRADLLLLGIWVWIHLLLIHLASFQAQNYPYVLYPLTSLLIAKMLKGLWTGEWNGVDFVAVAWAAGMLFFSQAGGILSFLPFGTSLGKGMIAGAGLALLFLPRWYCPWWVRSSAATFLVGCAIWVSVFRPAPADHWPEFKSAIDRIHQERGEDTPLFTTFFPYFHLLWYHDGPTILKERNPDETVPIPDGEGLIAGFENNFANWPKDRCEMYADAGYFKIMRFFPAPTDVPMPTSHEQIPDQVKEK